MAINLFLCGDVMLDRGVDQIMPYPGGPELREDYIRDARDYVALAARKNGPIPAPVDFSYVWGDALVELQRMRPDFRVINLETSVTTCDSYCPHKSIHYRMNPANIGCLSIAKIDCAVLANNHVLDFGHPGLSETLITLGNAGIKAAGAGENIERASEPAILERDGSRVLVYACGHRSSGASADWWAEKDKAGINFLPDCSDASLRKIRDAIAGHGQPGNLVIFSVHWGDNWGYQVDEKHRQFAHRLIDEAGVDVVHGHSSHHAKGIEIHRGKPILYGCGDFIDDYEGISGYEDFRNDLRLMYFLQLNSDDGTLSSLQMIPMQMKRFRLQYAGRSDTQWLFDVLKRESGRFGAKVELTSQNTLQVTM